MPDNQNEILKNRLMQVRKSLSMTQKAFAEALGYKQGHISEMESGAKNISKSIFYPLEKKLNVNIDWFETGNGTMFNNGIKDDKSRDELVYTGKQFKTELRKKGISDEEAASALSIEVEDLFALFSKVNIGKDNVDLIDKYLGIALKGIPINGSNKHGLAPTTSKDRDTSEESDKKQIPVYDIPVTASGVEIYDDEKDVRPLYYVQAPQFLDCEFGMIVRGESMIPTYSPGDVVFVKKVEKKYIMYGEAYWLEFGGYRTVKRLLASNDTNSIIADSDNPALTLEGIRRFASFLIERQDIRRLYIVKGHISQDQA